MVSLFSILIIIGIFSSGLFAPQGWNWAFIMALMITFIALIGKLITNRYSGIFINDRNKMTLSRFQLVIWTLIVLSAFITIGLERVKAGVPDPFAIQLPQQLWELLGISTAALVGSPLVLSTKIGKTPTPGAIEKAAQLSVKKEKIPANVNSKDKANIEKRNASALDTEKARIAKNADDLSGLLDSNEKFGDAKFSEMFTGDELGNKGYIDMAKVQMFFFTLLIAFGYMVLLVNLIMTKTDLTKLNTFPALTDSVVALLGISSGGYLTNKAVDHTKTA